MIRPPALRTAALTLPFILSLTLAAASQAAPQTQTQTQPVERDPCGRDAARARRALPPRPRFRPGS